MRRRKSRGGKARKVINQPKEEGKRGTKKCTLEKGKDKKNTKQKKTNDKEKLRTRKCDRYILDL